MKVAVINRKRESRNQSNCGCSPDVEWGRVVAPLLKECVIRSLVAAIAELISTVNY